MKKQGQKVLVERWRKGTGVVPPVKQAKHTTWKETTFIFISST